ncbi:nucleoside hydrolase [Cerasicoccus frondis]|uniref:nucleoside hydrolase n=1 Tax=Cerasicoccus frondis TaxID=490090 RepID=UPI002852505D|nr:nucleoside hydrolase [Cerasicoccus frondis]
MNLPFAPDALIRQLAWPTEPVDMVLDTDTYNEIDDQFALVYALLSPERMTMKAVYAAPFHNSRSSGPADGMEKSYEEILRLLDFMDRSADGFAFRGSTEWLANHDTPVRSEAVEHLIELARSYTEDRPLYVVAIGAITNVASALIAAPDIARKIVVLWLGGHPVHCGSTNEFNLQGDRIASRFIFDCGVPLVRFPCALVAQSLASTNAEMERFAKGRGQIGDYLYEIFSTYKPDMDEPGVSKVVWDIAPIAWLVQENGISSCLMPSPILNVADLTFSVDYGRHYLREVVHINRDVVYKDLFTKLAKLS